MRNYTPLDVWRAGKLKAEKGESAPEFLKRYNEVHPEKSLEEAAANFKAACEQFKQAMK